MSPLPHLQHSQRPHLLPRLEVWISPRYLHPVVVSPRGNLKNDNDQPPHMYTFTSSDSPALSKLGSSLPSPLAPCSWLPSPVGPGGVGGASTMLSKSVSSILDLTHLASPSMAAQQQASCPAPRARPPMSVHSICVFLRCLCVPFDLGSGLVSSTRLSLCLMAKCW
jgi:hypothetical protein